jgi:purine nucleosidase
MRVWIDTDVGSDVDDALAIAYVLRRPELELVGVSTVFGDVDLRSRIASALLTVAGAEGVPVVTGLGAPLTAGRKGVMFGHEGRGVVDDPAPVMRVATDPDPAARVDAIATAIASARPDVIVAIGPLTNVGALVAAGVTLPQLAIMGGRLTDVSLPGMIDEIPEWNWFCDPIAVRRVLHGHHVQRPLVVPAEVTFRTRLRDGDIELLAGGDQLAQVLAVQCRHWLTAQREILGSTRPGVALHDPLTAALLVEPALCPVAPLGIEVDTERAAAAPTTGAPNLDAAVDVDVDAVRDHLMATWLP